MDNAATMSQHRIRATNLKTLSGLSAIHVMYTQCQSPSKKKKPKGPSETRLISIYDISRRSVRKSKLEKNKTRSCEALTIKLAINQSIYQSTLYGQVEQELRKLSHN